MEKCNTRFRKWISILYRQAQIYTTNAFKEYNLSCAQSIFLVILYECDGINQEKLSEKLYIDKGATARAVKGLESQGLIRREVNEEDRRAYKLYLTDKALELKPYIIETMTKWEKILSNGMEEEEIQLVMRTLEQMSQKAIEYNQNTK